MIIFRYIKYVIWDHYRNTTVNSPLSVNTIKYDKVLVCLCCGSGFNFLSKKVQIQSQYLKTADMLFKVVFDY